MVSIDKYELMWHEIYDGVITEELVSRICEKDIELDVEIEALLEAFLEIDMNEIDMNEINILEQKIEECQKQKDGLQPIIEQAEEGLNYYLESGDEVWLIKPYSYQLLLIDDKKTFQRNNIYIMLGIIGAFAGIMADEKRYNMEASLKAAQRGRKEIIVIKVIWVFIITAIFAVAVHLIQFLMVNAAVEYSSLEATVQSLVFLRWFPFRVSIKQYLILLFTAYAGAAFLCGIVVFVVSKFRRDKISVMGICVFGIILPYILSII